LLVVFKDLINLYIEHIDIIYDASEEIFFRLELGIKIGLFGTKCSFPVRVDGGK